MTSSHDVPVEGAPSVQHRNAVLNVPAPGGWNAYERGVMECIADSGCTATVLQGRCTQRGLGPASFTTEIDRTVLNWAKQIQGTGNGEE